MTIEQQIQELRRSHRRWHVVYLAGIALAIFAHLAAIEEPELTAQDRSAVPEVIRARRFEVVDNQGKTVILLASMALGEEWSATDKIPISLKVFGSGAQLRLEDASRDQFVSISTMGDSEIWCHENGKQVRLRQDELLLTTVDDAAWREVERLGLVRKQVDAKELNSNELSLLRRAAVGRPRIWLRSDETTGNQVVVYSQRNTVAASMGMATTNTGYVTVYDSRGEPRRTMSGNR